MIRNNSNTTLKFLLYMLVFMVIVFAFVILIVIPGIREYKSVQSEYIDSNSSYQALLKDEESLSKQLETLKSDNRSIVETFGKTFEKENFITFAKTYFDDASLTPIESDVNSSALKQYQFNAQMRADHPKRFYEFIHGLTTFEGVVKVNFPISVVSEENQLALSFHISVYSMKLQ